MSPELYRALTRQRVARLRILGEPRRPARAVGTPGARPCALITEVEVLLTLSRAGKL